MSKSIQLNIRISPSHMYEIKKISKHLNITHSDVVRNAIQEYTDLFLIWRSRIIPDYDVSKERANLEFGHK